MIDADGDLETDDDQSLAAGWEFNLDTEATITDSSPVTGEGEEGNAWWELELSQTTSATITEDLQDGYELIDGFCIDLGALGGESDPMSRIRAAEEGDLFELEGDAINFDVEPDSLVGCIFVNALVPEDSAAGETATPTITLPPTDTFGGAATPTNESWRIMLVVMAGLLATVLILTPKRASRRR